MIVLLLPSGGLSAAGAGTMTMPKWPLRWTLVSFAERDFEGVYVFSVADAFELAIELGGGIVRVAIFVLVFGFGLALLESVVEIGLGERVE